MYSYIKELAERLHTLENQMQPAMVHPDMSYQAMNEVSSPRAYQDFSPPIDTGPIGGRKRTYSVFEGLPSSSFTQPPFNTRSQNAFGWYSFFPLLLNSVSLTAPRRGRNLARSSQPRGHKRLGAEAWESVLVHRQREWIADGNGDA